MVGSHYCYILEIITSFPSKGIRRQPPQTHVGNFTTLSPVLPGAFVFCSFPLAFVSSVSQVWAILSLVTIEIETVPALGKGELATLSGL